MIQVRNGKIHKNINALKALNLNTGVVILCNSREIKDWCSEKKKKRDSQRYV